MLKGAGEQIFIGERRGVGNAPDREVGADEHLLRMLDADVADFLGWGPARAWGT
jgi:hypothetical protein